jgi:hypothetical protein
MMRLKRHPRFVPVLFCLDMKVPYRVFTIPPYPSLFKRQYFVLAAAAAAIAL